jgi:hypothetical protein
MILMRRKTRALNYAFILSILATCIWFQYQHNAKQNRIITALQGQLREAEIAAVEAKTFAHNSALETEQLRTAASDTPRLRGEVATLRRELLEKEALGSKRSEPAARIAQPTKKQVVVFGTEAQDLGGSTPERAATSLIWAATAGDRVRLSDLLELPADVPDTDAPRHYEHFANMLSNKFAHLEFTGISYVRPTPDGTLRLGIQYFDSQTGKTNPFPFTMRQNEGAWKVVVEGKVPANF